MRQAVLIGLIALNGLLVAGESRLGDAAFKFGGQDLGLTVITQISDSPATDPAFLLKFSSVEKPLGLQSRGLLADETLKKDEPLSISEVVLDAKTRGVLVAFSLVDSRGHVRAIAALLKADGGSFTVLHEWIADCQPLGEAGFIRQKQSFSAKAGVFVRQFKNARVEGVLYKLDCGCPACASKTTEYAEDETWTWNAAKRSIERTAYEKRYIVQPSEGLLSVARKAYGDARLMGRLYKLNPELKNATTLKEGQGVIVEKE